MFNIQQSTHDYMNLIVTHECDRRCPFCVDKYVGGAGMMSLAVVEKALEFGQKEGIRDVLLIGGEPTSHPEIVRIARMVKEAGFRVVMTTNYSRPEVVRELDAVLDCLNVSYYRQRELPLQKDFRADLTLHTLIHSDQLSTRKLLDEFIDAHRENGHLKFSTLVAATKWAARRQEVPYLDGLDCTWVVLFNELLGQIYRGAIIKRYDRIINQHAHQSWKCHPDGQITPSWEWHRGEL